MCTSDIPVSLAVVPTLFVKSYVTFSNALPVAEETTEAGDCSGRERSE